MRTTAGIMMSILLCVLSGAAGTHSRVVAQEPSVGGDGEAELHLPPGDVTRWIDEMIEGLREIPVMERDDAADRVTELYIGRQEYLELLYAAGGLVAGEDHGVLDAHIRSAEGTFHELMTLTRTPDAGDAAIADAVERASADLAAARREILALELPLRPIGVAPAARGRAAAGQPVSSGLAEARSPAVRGIIENFERALVLYEEGRTETAVELVQSAYLDQFEPLEARLPGALVRSIERLIHLSLRPAMQRHAPIDEVAGVVTDARHLLLEADHILVQPMSRAAGFGQGFVIILREGLEAALLLSILLTGLRRVEGGERLRRAIGWGAGAACGSSIVGWFVVDRFLGSFGAQRELVEGVVTLVAAFVLVLVCNWLFRRTYVDDWKAYLESRLGRAAQSGSVLAVSALAFAVVFREGVETVLFYQALILQSDPGAVFLGLIVGLVVVAILAFGILRMGRRLPVRQLFTWTNAALVLLAFVLVGKGIYSLSEAGVFTPTPLDGLDLPPSVTEMFGIHPTGETLAAQLVLLVVLAATFSLAKRRTRVPRHATSS